VDYPGATRYGSDYHYLRYEGDGVTVSFKNTIKKLERQLIHDALTEACGNLQYAADSLGLKRTTLFVKVNKDKELRKVLKELRNQYHR
jgi:DNA-binding NtrC family response regulator